MKRNNLRYGMVVTTRNEMCRTVGSSDFNVLFTDEYGYLLDDDLRNMGPLGQALDIVKVRNRNLDGTYNTLWEREPERYYLHLSKELFTQPYLNYDGGDLEYFFDNRSERDLFKTRFTVEEIDDLPEEIKMLHLFKEAV